MARQVQMTIRLHPADLKRLDAVLKEYGRRLSEASGQEVKLDRAKTIRDLVVKYMMKHEEILGLASDPKPPALSPAVEEALGR